MHRSRFVSLIVSAAPLVVSLLSTSVEAGTVALNSYTNNPLLGADTRLNGSATDSSVMIDNVHSTVRLTSTDGVDANEKVAPFFSAGGTGAIGTLGDLGRGSFSVDWMLNSRGANTPGYVANIAAFRILVGGPSAGTFAELIWEAPDQTPIPAFSPGVGYDNVDIGSGKFYARYLGQNYGQGSNGPVNNLTLAQIAAGAALTPSLTNPTFSDATNVYGVQVSIGSAAGDYSANVGDINMTFDAAPVVPLPAAVWGGVALLGGLGARRRSAGIVASA